MAHGDVYRPIPPIPQQEFQQLVPVVAENSGFVNEMIMELLQDTRVMGDVGATLCVMAKSTQEPQYRGQVDEEAEEEEKEEGEEDDEDEEEEEEGGKGDEPSRKDTGGRRDKDSEVQTSSKKSWRDCF